MSEFTVDLEPYEDGEDRKVISIEVARKHLFSRRCKHHRIRIDPDFTHIECRDCKQQLNPVEWLSFLSIEWARIQRLYKMYTEAKKLYDEKLRTQCQHCKKITRVGEPTDFSKRLREREQQP